MSQTLEESARLRFDFLKRAFAGYYESHARQIPPPSEMEKREFGFLMFRERFMIRHRGFRLLEELSDAIIGLVPSDVHYSTAYYERPTLDMDRKGWLGADLVFDVDADHIETECKKSHDVWTCNGCGKVARGEAPKICPQCKSTKIEERTWMCDTCIDAARNEVMKLRSLLLDFGIKDDSEHVYFSGHRGYHLHVRNAEVRNLGEEERREIVDYVLGQGLDIEALGVGELTERGTKIIMGPERETPGWGGRVAKEVKDLFYHASLPRLIECGFRKDQAESFIESRTSVQAEHLNIWNPPGVSLTTWKKVFSNIVRSAKGKYALPATIDTVVSIDVHRLIRLPGTLNGKTGFKACEVPIDSLKEFDAFAEPVVLEGESMVHVSESPGFRIRDQRLGPFNNEKIVIPTSAAALLVAKGMAVPVET